MTPESSAIVDVLDLDGAEDAPVVCPGCQAINADPHAPWCSDASIERAREDADLEEEDDAPDGIGGPEQVSVLDDYDDEDGISW